MKEIAILGSGISSIASAYYLKKLGFKICLYEANDYFGGHTHTHEISVDGQKFPVDSGFLVHNDRTYPRLIKFFEELEIEIIKSDMTFSVESLADDIEWAGTNLNTLFSQRRNLIRPSFYSFIKEILRFNKKSQSYLKKTENNLSLALGELLEKEGYSKNFAYWYLLPMGGCIWSTPVEDMLKFPAYTFLRFCINHGLLQVFDRPQWKSIIGGCHTYTKKVIAQLDEAYLNEPVNSVEKLDSGKVKVQTRSYAREFDYVVSGLHAPDILKLVKTDQEVINTLGQFSYQPNKAILHTDTGILPKRKLSWSAWNYYSVTDRDGKEAVSVSYLLNSLQDIPVKTPIIVSLNPIKEISKDKIIKTMNYEHPLFDEKAVSSQSLMMDLQGRDNIYYGGAWLRYGFHEDGIYSALEIVEKIKNKESLS